MGGERIAVSTVRVHLKTKSWQLEAVLPVPDAPAPVGVWLPFLQALADQSATRAQAGVERAGLKVSCAKGCGACCRQLVAISLVEARALADLVEAMPEPRRGEIRARFQAAMTRARESGVLERDYDDSALDAEYPLAESGVERLANAWFRLGVACPFLEEESCSIHAVRPLVCRQYLVTSPSEVCARLFVEPVDRVEISDRLPPRLAVALTKLSGVSTVTIPLAMSLEIPPDIDAAVTQPLDPLDSLKAILAEIGDWRLEPVQEPERNPESRSGA